MSDRRRNGKGRRTGHTFLAIPHPVLRHENYYQLSDKAKVMLFELALQYNGSNNGDLCATLKILKPRGYSSNAKITSSVRELIDRGFIVKTRQGGRNIPNLFAVTWRAVDRCGGKLDMSETNVASNDWKRNYNFSAPLDGSKYTSPRLKEQENAVSLHLKKVK